MIKQLYYIDATGTLSRYSAFGTRSTKRTAILSFYVDCVHICLKFFQLLQNHASFNPKNKQSMPINCISSPRFLFSFL